MLEFVHAIQLTCDRGGWPPITCPRPSVSNKEFRTLAGRRTLLDELQASHNQFDPSECREVQLVITSTELQRHAEKVMFVH